MLRLVFCFAFLLSAPAIGEELDGVCRLSVSGAQWSGVAISENRILTVAHHRLPVGTFVRAEFGIGRHGAFDRVSVNARLLKNDIRKDLSLLEYGSPHLVRPYRIGHTCNVGETARIAGYIGDAPMELECLLTPTDGTVDGVKVLEFRGKAVSGMSGAAAIKDGSTVGIQFGGGDQSINAVSVESIREFMAE